MNKYVITLIFLISSFSAVSRTSIKEQRDLLKRYDLLELKPVQGKFKDSPHLFWQYLKENNKRYNEAVSAARKGKAKEAQKAIGAAIAEIRSTYIPDEYISGITELLDSLKSGSGISKLFPREAKLFLDPTEYPNAFSLPDGTVFITYGLMKQLRFDYNLLMAAYAHELAHFVLQHSFCRIYFCDKKAKKNKLLTDIFTAVSVSAAAYSDLKFAEAGISTNTTQNAVQLWIALDKAQLKDSKSYQMRYDREQEYEADILGYRFLESIGIDGAYYIDMLKSIKSDLEIFNNDESVHPLTDDRIALLEFLRTNPNLKPKPSTISDDDIYYQEIY